MMEPQISPEKVPNCRIAPVVLRELIRLKIVRSTSRSEAIHGNLISSVSTWAAERIASEESLTVGLPGRSSADNSYERRLFWWPSGVPREVLIGLVSSRLDRKLENWAEWFRGIRSVCAQVSEAKERLIVAVGTTTEHYVERAAELFGKPTFYVHANDSQSFEKWWRHVCEIRAATCGESGAVLDIATGSVGRYSNCVYVSPKIGAAHESGTSRTEELPLRDELVHSIAGQVTALYVTGKGTTDALMRRRVTSGRMAPQATRVMLGHKTPPKVAASLMECGCVGWHLSPTASPPGPSIVADQADTSGGAVRRPFHRKVELVPGDWLTHCTRRRVGPWPRQQPQEYLDQLLFEEPAADRSALATLKQIVIEQRLIASNQGVRGDRPVVCFTAVSLQELDELRVFRPHRGRWDFQPYGISVARSWLEQQGARPVRYASDADWEHLPVDERPYFQMERSITGSGREIDWTIEEEWRTTGDVNLRHVPMDQVLVFVATDEEATRVRNWTNWQVITR